MNKIKKRAKSCNAKSKNHFWKGGVWLKERVCQACGKDFFSVNAMTNSNKYRHKGNYCSSRCYGVSLIKPRIEKQCLVCSGKFSVIPANKDAKYCSRKCSHIGAAITSTKPREYHRLRNQMKEANRRARKKKAEGSFTKDEWCLLKRQYHHQCPSCGRREPEIKLTVDHVVPIYHGGTNWISNIQPLCKSCNSSKNTKTVRFSKKRVKQIQFNYEMED